jgi:hypothetical protein
MYLLNHILMLFFYLLAIGDIFTTTFAISAGAHEANWLPRLQMYLFGSKWVIARLLMALGSVYGVVHNHVSFYSWTGTAVFFGGSLITGYAVASNWILWKKLKKQSARQ